MSFVCSFLRVLLNVFLSLIGKLLPNKFKRYILLTTIYTKAVNEKLFAKLNLADLNSKLYLANDIKAMENISLISNRLWSKVELNALLKESVHCTLNGECVSLVEADGIGEKIIAMTPNWLKYNKAEMQRDITNLFSREKVYLTV